MKYRSLHRLAGMILILPFLAWASTAIFFLVRPGYSEAYAPLSLATEAMPARLVLPPTDATWLELRYLRSVLGEHLLVRTAAGWQHLDARSGEAFPLPDADATRRLLQAAMAVNPTRYGELLSLEGLQARSSTGVDISINWQQFSATQVGRDRRWIDRMYDIHYLRWTGFAAFDRAFGLLGLGLLIFMTWSGGRLLLNGPGGRRNKVSRVA